MKIFKNSKLYLSFCLTVALSLVVSSSDYTNTPVASGYATTSQINTELTKVETSVNSKLDKTGGTLTGDLDLNSNDLLNVKSTSTQALSINGIQVTSSGAVTTTLPAQATHGGKFLTTDGTTASWDDAPTINHLTTTTMVNDANLQVGMVIRTSEFSTGTSGGAIYDTVLTSSVTPNTFNIIIGVSDALISFVLRETAGSVVDARKFGAVEGTGTDNLLAIQALFDSIYTPKIGDNEDDVYEVSDTVTLPAQKDLLMPGTMHYTGAQTKSFLVLGSPTTTFNKRNLQVRVTATAVPDWATEDYIGVIFHNCNTCNIHIALTDNFTIGWQLLATNNPFAYNLIKLGHHDRNKVVGELRNAASGGFTNENTFFKGRFIGSTAAAHNTLDRFGIRIRSDSALLPNGNVFYSPSFEMQAASTSGLAIAADFENAIENKILNIRTEANDIPAFLIGTGCANNEITSSFGRVDITDTSETPSTITNSGPEKIRNNSLANWNSLHLGRVATAYDATNVSVAGVDTITTGGTIAVFATSFSIANIDYLETTGARGVLISIDTTRMKQFVVRRSALDSFGGRVVIKAYDAAGALLTGVAPKYISGQRGLDLNDVATWGGGYQTNSDSTGDVYINCHDDVKSIDVAITSGTAHFKLKSFSVSGVNSSNGTSLTVFRRSGAPVNHERFVLQSPQTSAVGTYPLNALFTRYPAVVGQPVGWKSTVAGTQGTIVALANL